jgi:yersiniabactin nonribosomal peptide synthetase
MSSTSVEAPLVALLVSAWTEAFGVAATPDSDFFALGGSSLQAVAIAEHVVERYPACEEIRFHALSAVFECPNLEAMAARLAEVVG